jgi:hypothetical protein
VLSVAAVALGGCEFSDVIEIGSDQTAGRGSGHGGRSGTPVGGTSSSGGGSGGSAGTAPLDNCGVEFESGGILVEPTAAAGELTPGTGGPFELGEYRLRRLIAHGSGVCFEPAGRLAQALQLLPGGTGSVVSDYPDASLHFVTAFQFTIEDNAIRIRPTCSDPAGPIKNPFGPFETYTAVQGGLVLVSAECRYQADYQLMIVPAR